MHRCKFLVCLPALATLLMLAGCSGGDPNATVKSDATPPGAATAGVKSTPASGGAPNHGTVQTTPKNAQ
jgi:hypothetical protein